MAVKASWMYKPCLLWILSDEKKVCIGVVRLSHNYDPPTMAQRDQYDIIKDILEITYETC